MEKEKLWKLVSNEIEWMSHYGYREDRLNLDLKKDSIYDQIRSIGYAKVNTPLDLRCVGWLSFRWSDDLKIENLVPLNERRDTLKNLYSPTEIWVKLFPDDYELIYNKINKI